ncbi:MAG: hypothetical protein V7754_06040 [Halioglobus sp.]
MLAVRSNFSKFGAIILLSAFCAVAMYSCDGGSGGGGGTQKVTVGAQGRISVDVSANPETIAPGEDFSLLVNVTNHYSMALSIRLTVSCPEYFSCPDIDRGPRDGYTVYSHESKSLRFTVSSQVNTPAGRHTFSVTGTRFDAAPGFEPKADSAVVEVGPIDSNEAPVATITSHADQSEVSSRTIVIKGSASDPDGVRRLEINGHPATSNDGFSTWRAKLPLDSGLNSFTVLTTDEHNNSNMEAARLTVYNTLIYLSHPIDIKVDEVRQQLLVTDFEIGALIAFDLESGAARIVSGPGFPDDTVPFVRPGRLAVDSAGGRAWVLDNAYEGLIAIDLITGKRTRVPDSKKDNALIITSKGSFADRPYHLPRDMIFNPGGNNVLVVIQIINPLMKQQPPDYRIQTNRVIAIDPISGQRSIFADEHTPDDSHPVYTLNQIVYDTTSNRIIATTKDSSTGIYEINPVTGERSVFVKGSGMNPEDLELDPGNPRVLFLSRQIGAMDLVTGERSTLWESDFLYQARRLAVDSLNNRALLLFFNNNHIGAVDLGTGEESILSSGK